MTYSAPLVILILLHTLDGREVAINPKQVTSMHAAKEGKSNKLFTDDAQCIIGMTDGKLISVAENCDNVKRMIEGAK